MARASRGNDERVLFWCPGCDEAHAIHTRANGWTWNGDLERPTFSPSVLLQATYYEPRITPENVEQWHREPWEQQPELVVCHSFVVDGEIQFLGDCTHQLAGQTVPLPEWPGHG